MYQSALKHDDIARNGEARPPRILIVDDIEDNRTVLLRRFQRRGFEVVEADSGFKAIQHVNADNFDVVLLDVMMPEMDGIETTRRLKAVPQFAKLPVIMITGQSEGSVVVDSLKAGACGFLVKPFARDTLIAKLRQVLNGA